MIHTHLVYSAPVLTSINQALMKKIFTKQKKAIRIISKSKYNSHTDVLFAKYDILPYPQLLKFSALKFMWQYKCNKLPKTFLNTFSVSNPNASNEYDLRTSNDFYVPIVRKASIFKLPLYYYPKLWNDLDLQFKTSNKLDEILPDIRKYLMDEYSEQNKCQTVPCFICRRE